jgi:hypothetical protein
MFNHTLSSTLISDNSGWCGQALNFQATNRVLASPGNKNMGGRRFLDELLLLLLLLLLPACGLLLVPLPVERNWSRMRKTLLAFINAFLIVSTEVQLLIRIMSPIDTCGVNH